MTIEFFPVPRSVVGREDVSHGAALCLGALYAYERRGKGWPCVAQLVEDMKAPRRTVTRWLAELTHAALVTSVADGREVHYAPARCAKTGALRDLHPSAGDAPEVAHDEPERAPPVAHVPAPKMAHVAEGHAPQLAHVESERGSRLAHVAKVAPSSGIERSDPRRSELRSDVRVAAREARGLGFHVRPSSEVERRMRAFAEAYGAAYRKATSRVWLAPSALDAIERGAPQLPHRAIAEQLASIVDWLDAQEGDATEIVLRGAFADPWMRENGFPLGRIAADPGRYTLPPKPAADTPAGAKPDVAYREAQDLSARVAESRELWEAPPVDIAATLRGVGRAMP